MWGNALVADAKVVRVTGGSVVGAHRLGLTVEFRSTQHVPAEGMRLVGTACHVSAMCGSREGDVGPMVSDSAPFIPLFPASASHATFSAVVSRARLEALEALRAGGDLEFRVRTVGTVVRKLELPYGFEESVAHAINRHAEERTATHCRDATQTENQEGSRTLSAPKTHRRTRLRMGETSARFPSLQFAGSAEGRGRVEPRLLGAEFAPHGNDGGENLRTRAV